MKIYFKNQQSLLRTDWRSIKRLAQFVLEQKNCEDAEVGIVFVDNRKIIRLNRQYFGKEVPTDVIAFPMNRGKGVEFAPELLGDVVISVEKALEWAKEHRLEPYAEVSLYLIHGLLHLLGYDDIIKTKKDEMVKKQQALLGLARRKGLLVSA